MKHQNHLGQMVRIGEWGVYLGGAMYRPKIDLSQYDLAISFLELDSRFLRTVGSMGTSVTIRRYPIPDFGGVPNDWPEFIKETIEELRSGKKVLGFCLGGHGRTGTFLASLIALLEPSVFDPIAEARSRYCEKAVETKAQMEAVFTLKGQLLPSKYANIR